MNTNSFDHLPEDKRLQLLEAYHLSTQIVRLLTESQHILRNPILRRQEKDRVITVVFRTRVILYRIRDLLSAVGSTDLLILQWLSRTNNLLEVLPNFQTVNIMPNTQ